MMEKETLRIPDDEKFEKISFWESAARPINPVRLFPVVQHGRFAPVSGNRRETYELGKIFKAWFDYIFCRKLKI
jgi:hypothetical protein